MDVFPMPAEQGLADKAAVLLGAGARPLQLLPYTPGTQELKDPVQLDVTCKESAYDDGGASAGAAAEDAAGKDSSARRSHAMDWMAVLLGFHEWYRNVALAVDSRAATDLELKHLEMGQLVATVHPLDSVFQRNCRARFTALSPVALRQLREYFK